MPIYEFECDACGARFERLATVGTESARCPECATEHTRRVLSAQAPAMKLVKSGGDTRRQERRNDQLRKRTKDRFKARRRRGRGRDG